jgi:hypothetical protein
MSSSASPKQKSTEVLSDAVRQRAATKTTAKQEAKAEDARFANIQANVFFQTMFSAETKPEEKRAEVAKILTFSGTKEENRANIKAFETFKEYLQSKREEMAQEIIRLTDTEAFSELQSTYKDMNQALLDFDDRMRPLTDIIDAIYTLRTNNKTFDTFREIQEDKAKEAALKAARDAAQAKVDGHKTRIDAINADIAALGQQKSFFGLGGIKQEAREQIARYEEELATINADLTNLAGEITALDAQVGQGRDEGEFAKEKAKVRELLDLNSDEHVQRSRDLVDSALNFVNTSKSRISSVREHLGQMDGQVENLFDANNMMGTVYAVLNEGINDAAAENQKKREALVNAPEGEDTIAKMTREQNRMHLEQHLSQLNASAADTMATFSDLTSGAIRIKTMKDAVEQQSAMARTMHSQGISGVADRLSVVLQAVSSAALGESSAMAKDTLARMSENTNKVAQKESIRIAMGIDQQNSDLEKAIADLGSYGDVVRTATDITRTGLSEMRTKLDELKKLADTVRTDVQDSIAVTAESMREESAASTAKPAPAAGGAPDPFGIGKK